MLCVLVLGGCTDVGKPDASPAPSASPTPKPVITYTQEQLIAALPAVDDIAGARAEALRCPGGDTCDRNDAHATTASVAFDLEWPDTLDPAEKEIAEHESWSKAFAFVSATVFDTDTSAAQKFQSWKDEKSAEQGPFDTAPIQGEGKTFTPGQQGERGLEDLNIGQWTGAMEGQAFALIAPDGDASPLIYESNITLVRGSVLVSVGVNLPSAGREVEEAEKLARELAERYVDALG